jgi:hypothetical protein
MKLLFSFLDKHPVKELQVCALLNMAIAARNIYFSKGNFYWWVSVVNLCVAILCLYGARSKKIESANKDK